MNDRGNLDVSGETLTSDARSDAPLPGLQSLLDIVVANAIEALRPLVARMFANVDDFLFDMAEKSDVAELHSMSFDAMRRIRAHRDAISDKFFLNITNSVLTAWGKPPQSKKSSGDVVKARFNRDEMTLLNEDETEVAAAVSGIVSKGNVRYGYELGSLTRTLNSISRCATVDETTNPLGVSSIARSFNDAITPLSLDVQILLCLLKLFERDVSDLLGGIYSAALEELENSGVSVIDHTADERTVVDRRLNRNDAAAGNRGTAEFAELRNCLSASVRNRDIESASSERFVSVDVGQLLESVSAVQNQYLEQVTGSDVGNQSSIPNLKSFLLSLPTDHGGFQKAGKVEQDTLQLISDLFEHMFRNANLSLASKVLIARLQLPVLKVALLDKSIFSDADHPTRKLINRLAIDGIGWPSNAVLLERNPLYLTAEELVRRINDEFTDDISIFDRLLDEWNKQTARKRSRIENAEKRINEAALGRAKLDAAKGIVRKAVSKRATGSWLPPAVASFITREWSNALVMTCIKFGTNSDEWHMGSDTLDDLLTACQPAGRKEDAEVRARNLKRLVSRLGEGLILSGSTEVEVRETLDVVIAALEKVTNEDEDWFSGTTEYQVENLQIIEEIVIADIVHPDETNTTIDPCLSTLQPGDWIEIDGPSADDGPLRCKLIVVVNETRTYVFGNDVGLKVCEKSGDELAQGLATGEVRIIREELLVERAIDELLVNLQSTMQV